MEAPAPARTYFLVFFAPGFSASGFLYVVATVPPIVSSMPFADSANGPVGCTCKYVWNAWTVPSTGVTLPVFASVLAFERSTMPYW